LNYTVYKITNKIDGKIYIGKHQTKDLNDGYMGSGKLISRAIQKYGIENFEKEILFQFDNEADMNEKEAELVSEEFCMREDTYNLCPGGHGGWGYMSLHNINGMRGKKQTELQREVARETVIKLNADSEFKEKNKKATREFRRKNPNHKPFLGKKHTEESLDKMRGPREKSSGEKNSQHGTMWITNGIENKKIKKIDNIPEGWYKGRKFDPR